MLPAKLPFGASITRIAIATVHVFSGFLLAMLFSPAWGGGMARVVTVAWLVLASLVAYALQERHDNDQYRKGLNFNEPKQSV